MSTSLVTTRVTYVFFTGVYQWEVWVNEHHMAGNAWTRWTAEWKMAYWVRKLKRHEAARIGRDT